MQRALSAHVLLVVVRLLLARQGVELNQAIANGATALIIASQEGHVEVVRLLLARQGVEVNTTACLQTTTAAATESTAAAAAAATKHRLPLPQVKDC